MVTAEPLLQGALFDYPLVEPLLYPAVLLAVLGAGLVRHYRRLESRIDARLSAFDLRQAEAHARPALLKRGGHMRTILVPVDGSPNALRAVRDVVVQHGRDRAVVVHLLNVQPPFPRHVTQFLSGKDLQSFHRDRGEDALRASAALLDAAGVPYTREVQVGHRAEAIAATARRVGCDYIVMGTARKNSLTRMVEASVTNKVLELTPVPVKVIAGDAISKVERYGIPAAIATGLGLLVLALD
jgi:nucleotide-binding universal stress UspA family protein